MSRLSALVLLLIVALALPASAGISINARFDPPRIAEGARAQYIVEIVETSDHAQPEVERISRLPIEDTGRLQFLNGRTSNSRSTRIINGQAEYSVTQQLIVDVKAPGVGSYTVPAYDFRYKSNDLRVPAATLTVVERAADAAPTADELIFLETDAPETLYLGQSTQIHLKLYIAENIRLTGLNRFDRSADGFTVSELPDSQESVELKNGRRYRVLTWPLTITPIQTGAQALNFQFNVSANLPNQNNRSNPFGRPGFGNSIFDDFFGRSEQFTIYNTPTTINVRPLPSAGQPSSFSGAIGDFALEVYTDLNETRTGEPIMLSLEISGVGNFERIGAPEFPDTDQWRGYEPEASFQPRSADDPLRGTKRFDYVLIPTQSGQIEIPSIDFSFFDTENGAYVELDTPAIPITVRPGATRVPEASSGPQTPTAQSQEVIPLAKELSMEEALLTLEYQQKPSRNEASPILQDKNFWVFNIGIAIGLTALLFWLHRRRRLSEDSDFANKLRIKREAAAAIRAARQSQDPETFYTEAPRAIRLTLSARSGHNLQNATAGEIASVIRERNLDESIIEAIEQVFASADALRFGNGPAAGQAIDKSTLERILKAL